MKEDVGELRKGEQKRPPESRKEKKNGCQEREREVETMKMTDKKKNKKKMKKQSIK